MTTRLSSTVHNQPRRNLWYERFTVCLALANLLLVTFDFTYVPWRNFWFRYLPPVTKLYDPVKGIEPHRDTTAYLEAVNSLEQSLGLDQSDSAVVQNRLQDPTVQKQLQELRDRSSELVQNNPFAAAEKSGTLEKIKNRIRERIFGQRQRRSSRDAFATFWSRDYLAQKGVAGELAFFNQEIRPLIASNYYRTIGENGAGTDWFWLMDLPFMGLFGLEFLARTFYLKRRYSGVAWLDTMVWRWYDLLFLLPFWRFLRVVPIVLRLDQAKMIHLDRIRNQASQGFVANLSENMAEVVVLQIIDQLQAAIAQGDIAQWLLKSSQNPYIDLNQRNEIQEITNHLLKTTVYQVMPKIKPDLEALFRHTIDTILSQSPAYQSLKGIPLVGDVPRQINQRLVTEVTDGAYGAIVKALEDQIGSDLVAKLAQNFGQSLIHELQQQQSIQELESLAVDLLEEVKVNYVSRLGDTEPDRILSETRQLHQTIHSKGND